MKYWSRIQQNICFTFICRRYLFSPHTFKIKVIHDIQYIFYSITHVWCAMCILVGFYFGFQFSDSVLYFVMFICFRVLLWYWWWIISRTTYAFFPKYFRYYAYKQCITMYPSFNHILWQPFNHFIHKAFGLQYCSFRFWIESLVLHIKRKFVFLNFLFYSLLLQKCNYYFYRINRWTICPFRLATRKR